MNAMGISGASASSDLVVDGTTLVVNANSNYNGPATVRNSGALVANAAVTTTAVTVSSNSTLSGTGSFDNGTGVFSIIAVPEPARVVLLLAGIQAVLLRRRRVSSRHSRC